MSRPYKEVNPGDPILARTGMQCKRTFANTS